MGQGNLRQKSESRTKIRRNMSETPRTSGAILVVVLALGV